MQNEIDDLLDDVSYLQDEAEALTYVIEEVPYDETTPDGDSIAGYLLQIIYSQSDYYRPVIEAVYQENRLIRLTDFAHDFDKYAADQEEDTKQIQKIIRRISKQRASLISFISKFTKPDWMKAVRDEKGRDISLLTFTRRMVTQERALLKKIADLILIYQKEREQQRDIERKASSRKSWMG